MKEDELYRRLIKDELDRRNLSVNALAQASGMSESGLRDILSGKISSTTVARLAMIAKGLDIPIARFFETDPDFKLRDDTVAGGSIIVDTEGLPVAGEVQAGAWLEDAPIDYAADGEAQHIPLVPDPRYRQFRQFALLVKGNSMNRFFPDGVYVCCADVGAIRTWQNEDFAVVVRTRDEGALWEATVKQVMIPDENTIELWPRSTDPRYQTPIVLTGDEPNTEIQLKGLVLGSYRPAGVPYLP